MHRCSHLDLGHQCGSRDSLSAQFPALWSFNPLHSCFPKICLLFFADPAWSSDVFRYFPCIWTKDLLNCSGCNLLMVAQSDSQFSDPESIVDCTFAPTWIDLEIDPPRQILGYEFWDNDNVPSNSLQRSYFGWRNVGSSGGLIWSWVCIRVKLDRFQIFPN